MTSLPAFLPSIPFIIPAGHQTPAAAVGGCGHGAHFFLPSSLGAFPTSVLLFSVPLSLSLSLLSSAFLCRVPLEGAISAHKRVHWSRFSYTSMRSLSIKKRERQGAALSLRSEKDGAKPFEVYGFAGSIGSFVAFGAYVFWAYVPETWLHALGITYYPSRYWAVAIPSYVMVAILFVLGIYISLNFLSTPPPQSSYTLFDDHTRVGQDTAVAGAGAAFGDECPIHSYSDMPIIEVNAMLLGGAFEEQNFKESYVRDDIRGW